MKHQRRSCVVDSGRANFYGDILLWGCAGEVRRGSDWGKKSEGIVVWEARSKGGSCANCGVGILTACGIMNSIRLGWIEIELRIYGCVKRPDFTTVCFHPMKISLYHSPLFHFFFFCFYDRSNPIQSNPIVSSFFPLIDLLSDQGGSVLVTTRLHIISFT